MAKEEYDPFSEEARKNQYNVHLAPSSFSTQRAGIEVYLTDEEGFQKYVSPYNAKATSNSNSADVENENSEEESSDEENKSVNEVNDTAFTLCQGEVVETFYYTDLTSMSLEADYKEMTSGSSFNRREVNLNHFYKGIRLKLLSEWEEPNKSLDWFDLKDASIGFITEQTFKDDGVEVKINGMEMLLEQTLAFEFKGMYRADIIREILLSAGLNPMIDVTGLDNDITDFTNESKGNASSSSNKPIGESSGNIAELAQQVCQGKTTDRAKAQAIHTYIRNHVDYPEPNYNDHKKCPMEVLRSGLSNCCDRARLGHEMANAVGLQNRGVHGPGHVWIQYKIGSKWVDSDPGVSRPNLGSVWEGMSGSPSWSFPAC